MTPEESVQFYEKRQEYKWKCEEFNEQLLRFFENYKPKHPILKSENLNT